MYHVRIISKKRLREFWADHPDAELALRSWFKIASQADWANIQDVRKQFPTADGVVMASGRVITVFNIRGNHYRLMVDILFKQHLIYVCEVMTHARYSTNRWKDLL